MGKEYERTIVGLLLLSLVMTTLRRSEAILWSWRVIAFPAFVAICSIVVMVILCTIAVVMMFNYEDKDKGDKK